MADESGSTGPEPSDKPASAKIALFTFDEVRRFEVAAVKKRRQQRDRPGPGRPIPLSAEGRRDKDEEIDRQISPLTPEAVKTIMADEEIERRQRTSGPSLTRPKPVATDMTGLALSGGGIRSAAFSLGAMQALHAHDALDKFDYLSTVSGGGYLGAAVSAGMSKNEGKFPFATGKDDIRDSDSVGHLRNFSNYLMPRNRSFIRNFSDAAAILLRGIFANIVMIAPLLLLAAMLSAFLWRSSGGFSERGFVLALFSLLSPNANNVQVAALMTVLTAILVGLKFARVPLLGKVKLVVWSAIALAPVLVLAIFFCDPVRTALQHSADQLTKLSFGVPIVVLLAEGAVLVCWGLLRSIEGYPGDDADSYFLRLAGTLLLVTVATTGLEGIPYLMSWMSVTDGNNAVDQVLPLDRIGPYGFGFILLIAFAVAAWSERINAVAETRKGHSRLGTAVRKLISKGTLLFAAAIFPIAFIAVFGWVAVAFTNSAPVTFYWSLGAVAGLIVIALALGPNSYSLHRFYRDRLKAAFLVKEALYPDSATASNNQVGELMLSELDTDLAPYHLLNTALNLQGSQEANQRGREADFFTFSPQFVGSDLTFYSPVNGKKIGMHTETPAIEKLDPKLDMATVVAISGAAASANMGSATIRVLSPILAFLNIRLGYWLANPRVSQLGATRWSKVKRKVASKFYLAMEMFGLLHERSNQLYLTDGGHIENLGIYQLLKRGCQLIVAIDAEADPSMSFPSLLKMERFARIDLGVRIDLSWDHTFRGDTGFPFHHWEWGEPRPHCAVGKITYPDLSEGLLIYVKSSLTGDERDYVLDYKRRHPVFPHEQTSDQFFTEEQFEVYRALGFHAVNGFFSRKDAFAMSPELIPLIPDADRLYHIVGRLLPGANLGILDTDTAKA